MMTIRVSTWHSPEFNIFTEDVDPQVSPYAITVEGYATKVMAFYGRLGVRSAIWTTPEIGRPNVVELGRTTEYLLEVNEDRVVAYVDATGWSDYLWGRQVDFEFSTMPKVFASTNILIATPVRHEEVKAIRRYRHTNGPSSFVLVEDKRLE